MTRLLLPALRPFAEAARAHGVRVGKDDLWVSLGVPSSAWVAAREVVDEADRSAPDRRDLARVVRCTAPLGLKTEETDRLQGVMLAMLAKVRAETIEECATALEAEANRWEDSKREALLYAVDVLRVEVAK